jgi:site-specific DNA-methyltransferase (adenine-specific)
MAENVLYYGDNLEILRRYIKDETIDLIYLDPPFKSNKDYNILFTEQNGSRAAAQIRAFKDTWRWDQAAAAAYREVVENGPQRVSQVMQSFRTFLDEADVMAYLAMMAPRLIELKRVLKRTGSIYLHCDSTASHYLKILTDAVFSPNRFLNEIAWCYRQGGRSNRFFGRKHDTIFWYCKSDQWVFNADASSVRIQYHGTGGYQTSGKGVTHKPTGKTYKPDPRGKIVEDWWDIPALPPMSKERLSYPTQKPESLLERILEASSNEGDAVLDPFCGCGTTIVVAQRLKRKWIGIDITHLAVALMKHRLKDMFGNEAKYEVIGEPVSLPDAKTLAQNDPYQFQWWALGLVGARPVEQKKGADKGIDGRLYFDDEADNTRAKTKQIIFSVKAGHVSVAHVRDLRGVVEREKAQIGILICMEEPTKPMRTEAASAGFYKSRWGHHPILQILTVEEVLKGKKIDYPHTAGVNVTFKKAPKAKRKKVEYPKFGCMQGTPE